MRGNGDFRGDYGFWGPFRILVLSVRLTDQTPIIYNLSKSEARGASSLRKRIVERPLALADFRQVLVTS